MATGNKRNTRTTHPNIRARREGALERLTVNEERAAKDATYKLAKEQEREALVRKLGQRKQGSAA